MPTTRLDNIPLPAAIDAHAQPGDNVLVDRGGLTVLLPLTGGSGSYRPAAAAVNVVADAPRALLLQGGKWAVATNLVGFTAALHRHLALHVGGQNAAADALMPGAYAGTITTKLWTLGSDGHFTLITADQALNTPVWLARKTSAANVFDIRLMPGAAAPAVGSGNGRVQIGYISDISDKANDVYGVTFDFRAASGWSAS